MPMISHATVSAQPSTRSGVPIRRLVAVEHGATQTEAWEQVLPPGAEIPLHYHDVEETVVFLGGQIEAVIGEETTVTAAPVTAFVPATILHSFRNVGDVPAQMIVFFPALQPAVIYLDGERRYAKGSQHEE
ncbi:MAG: cupin domain-containing protein [Caldilineaceae bacterium]